MLAIPAQADTAGWPTIAGSEADGRFFNGIAEPNERGSDPLTPSPGFSRQG